MIYNFVGVYIYIYAYTEGGRFTLYMYPSASSRGSERAAQRWLASPANALANADTQIYTRVRSFALSLSRCAFYDDERSSVLPPIRTREICHLTARLFISTHLCAYIYMYICILYTTLRYYTRMCVYMYVCVSTQSARCVRAAMRHTTGSPREKRSLARGGGDGGARLRHTPFVRCTLAAAAG